MNEYINIGRTKKTHGAAGELKVIIEDAFLQDFVAASVIFLSIQGKVVPYFLEGIRGNSPLIIKFEEVDSKEEAQKISNKAVFLRESDIHTPILPASTELESYLKYEGFQMVELEHGKIGPIIEIIEMPQQILALVAYQGKEIYIPLNEQFIKKVKEVEKIIIVELPEGLLEL